MFGPDRARPLPLSEGNELDDRGGGHPDSPTYGQWDEREILPKPDDPKVTRIVRYESGTGEVIEIIEVPDPHKAAEYKVPTNDELRPKPGCRFKVKTAIRRVGGATPLFSGVRGRLILGSSR